MSLLLTKESKLFYNSHGTATVEDEEVGDIISRYLQHEVVLEEGVKLRNIFDIIRDNADLFDLIIPYWINEFIEEAYSPAEKLSDLKYLCLSYHAIITSEGEFELPLWPTFDGMGEPRPGEPGMINDEGLEKYAVDFSAVNTLMELPVKYDLDFVIYDEKKRTSPKYKLDEGRFVSLYNLIYAIIWELSFYGSPSQRQEVCDGITESMKEVKESLGIKDETNE